MQGQTRDYTDSYANLETERREGGVDCPCTITSLISVDIILIPNGKKEIRTRLKSLQKR